MKKQNYICGGNKFTYSNGYIALPLDINNLPEATTVSGVTLLRKSSFHVSLLCVADLLTKDSTVEQKVIDEFCTYIQSSDISFVKFLDEFLFAEVKERKSLVIRCEVSNLEGFVDALSSKLGFDIPYQPTHVTLYTLQPDAGIGLNSPEAMEANSKEVQAAEEIRRALGFR